MYESNLTTPIEKRTAYFDDNFWLGSISVDTVIEKALYIKDYRTVKFALDSPYLAHRA